MKHTLILSLMLVGMAACTAAPTPKTSRPAHWAQSVKADANLHRVDDKLYRSEQPVADDGDTILPPSTPRKSAPSSICAISTGTETPTFSPKIRTFAW